MALFLLDENLSPHLAIWLRRFGYAAHPDETQLFEFIREKSDTLKKVYAIHGEPKSSLVFVQKIRDNLGIEAFAPKYGESVEI